LQGGNELPGGKNTLLKEDQRGKGKGDNVSLLKLRGEKRCSHSGKEGDRFLQGEGGKKFKLIGDRFAKGGFYHSLGRGKYTSTEKGRAWHKREGKGGEREGAVAFKPDEKRRARCDDPFQKGKRHLRKGSDHTSSSQKSVGSVAEREGGE